FGLPLLLGFEEEIGGLLFDYLGKTLRCVACVVEGGQHDDPRSVDVLESVAWIALASAGVIAPADIPGDHSEALVGAAGERARCVYDLRHRERIADRSFTMHDGVDAHDPVRPGQAIAEQLGRPVVSPVRGEVFLPNRQAIKNPGDDAFFIVREVSPGWLGLSARCRRSAAIRALIAGLPGVHRCEQDPHALLVDGRLAAVLKRQVFHLLGYRILRRGDPVRAARSRPWAVFRGLLLAAWHRRVPDGRDDCRFWLVARRGLDIASDPARAGGV
ncbi:MAG: hypothetical protein AAGA55_07430, partial [Planctomycetota bacterium]